jgi:hypothetical protein
MSIESRIAKLERQTAAPLSHTIVVNFGDGQPVEVSCHGQTFTRKPGEPYDDFISRASGNRDGVTVLFGIPDMPRPKHCRVDPIYLPDRYEA